jgi:HAD superfamily hydrolase (TIGR01509 family)
MLKAVIFDLDGVVADSHPIHEMAWKSLLVEAGLKREAINVDFLYAGHPRREILKHYLGELTEAEIQHWGRRKDELYELSAKKLQAKPGIPRVLVQLNEVGIACALATSAGRSRTFESLNHLGLAKNFSVVVTGEDVRNAKPAPDIFLLAAKKLGVEPGSCVVVEDSVAGVQAAIAGGMKCIGFTSAKRSEELSSALAGDVVSEFPSDAVRYFQSFVSVDDPLEVTLVSARAKTSRQDI